MRTLTEKYNGVLKGLFSKDQFLRDARMEQSNFITQHNSYGDAINILLNKGLISEIALEEINNQTIEYRGCIIEPSSDPYAQNPGFEWHRPGWVDYNYDEEKGYWYGYGDTVEQCKDDIDDAYDEYGEVEGEMTEKMGNPDHTAAAIPLEDVVTPEDLAASKEAEDKDIEDVRAMLDKERFKPMKFDDPKLDREYEEWLATNDDDGPLEEVSLEEGPARNNPKIEKLVAGINDLIAQAVDSDGDPIGVVEPDTTWLQPYVYDPIQYKNGHLKITTRKQNSNTPEVDIILSRDMEFDGIPTLRLIMRMYKKAIKQAGRASSMDSDMMEKKLTDAEKAGKEKIVKSLAKAGMSKKDPKTYAIATTQAKELYEGFAEVNEAYSDILEVYKNHYTQLSNMSEDDAYALHELLKSYFNRLFEGAIDEPSSEVKKGDVLKHTPSGVELEITNVVYNDKGGVRLYRGKITNAGTISGVEAAGKMYQIRPTLVGTTWFVKEKEQSVTENLDNYSKDAITDMIINLSRYEGTEELIADLKKILKQRSLGKLKKEQLSEDTYESIETYTDASALARRLSRTEVGTFYIFEVEKTIREFIVSKEPIAGAELAGAFLDGKPVVDNTLQEAKEEGYQSPKPELPLDVLHHGIRFELDKKEIGNTPTEEEYMKAYKAATKNLEKDLLHYKREEGAEDAPVSKSDEMIKVKLKESFKNIIRNILSESASDKKAFNLNGKVI